MVGDKVLAIIPARGGSKSIPRKNIRPFGGHPLIAWSIAAAQQARTVGRVLVSTDDAEIAEIARTYGAAVPFLRPPELARDDTPDYPVFEHTLGWLEREEGYVPEIVVHLRPTSPLRPLDCVDRAVSALVEDPSASSIRSVTPPSQNPYKMWRIRDNRLAPILEHAAAEPYNLPRQALPATYWQTGHVDAIRHATLFERRSMTGAEIQPLIIDPDYSLDIDTLANWRQGESLLANADLACVRPERRRDLRRYRALVLDFDGVLTDNRVHVLEDGRETVVCHRGDGLGIAALRDSGMPIVVLSTETNGVVAARCRKLGLSCKQGQADKAAGLRAIAAQHDLPLEDIIYVGNDVNDLACLAIAGLSVVPADAHPDASRIADWILSRAGGDGAVRELCDHLLEARTA